MENFNPDFDREIENGLLIHENQDLWNFKELIPRNTPLRVNDPHSVFFNQRVSVNFEQKPKQLDEDTVAYKVWVGGGYSWFLPSQLASV